jgi:hypothetical protein
MEQASNTAKPKRLIPKIAIVAFVTIAIFGYPVFNMCRYTGFCSVAGLEGIWHMTHKDEYGLIGQHLEPGREYYFEVRPATFLSDYPQHAPVSAEQIETQETVVISTVYANQKTDEDLVYKRVREPYIRPIDPTKLGLVVNGDYFFSVAEGGSVGDRVSIDVALRQAKYVKVQLYLKKVKAAELVTRISEGHNKYTYWPRTGYLRENIGYRIESRSRKYTNQ